MRVIWAKSRMVARAILLIVTMVVPAAGDAQTFGAPLVLEAKIPLGEVSGRIDHLAIDVKRQRLFVAELGNDTLGVVDLAAGKVLRTIAGLKEPQGVAYVAFADSIYVANAGDGSVHVLRGDDLARIGRIELGDDADNVRVDAQRSRVLVGYGKGALAVIDPASRTKAADIRLKGHPEGFQIDEAGTQVFVNVPDARVALSSQDGRVAAKVETCGDADDVFVDAKRHRVYVSCGEGVVDVLEQGQTGYRHLARVPTGSGARTSLFVPELDRLFVAVRARSNEPAAIWVFRPSP